MCGVCGEAGSGLRGLDRLRWDEAPWNKDRDSRLSPSCRLLGLCCFSGGVWDVKHNTQRDDELTYKQQSAFRASETWDQESFRAWNQLKVSQRSQEKGDFTNFTVIPSIRTRSNNKPSVFGSVLHLICIQLPLQQDLGFAHAPLLPVLPGDPVVFLQA